MVNMSIVSDPCCSHHTENLYFLQLQRSAFKVRNQSPKRAMRPFNMIARFGGLNVSLRARLPLTTFTVVFMATHSTGALQVAGFLLVILLQTNMLLWIHSYEKLPF